jgi:hypothetical protein
VRNRDQEVSHDQWHATPTLLTKYKSAFPE